MWHHTIMISSRYCYSCAIRPDHICIQWYDIIVIKGFSNHAQPFRNLIYYKNTSAKEYIQSANSCRLRLDSDRYNMTQTRAGCRSRTYAVPVTMHLRCGVGYPVLHSVGHARSATCHTSGEIIFLFP